MLFFLSKYVLLEWDFKPYLCESNANCKKLTPIFYPSSGNTSSPDNRDSQNLAPVLANLKHLIAIPLKHRKKKKKHVISKVIL